MKRFKIICTKESGDSGMFDDHACRFRWKTGENVLTVTEIGMVRRGLGGVDRGQGTRPATLMELLQHVGSPIGPLKEATVVPVQGSAVLPKTHLPAAKQAEDNKVLIAKAEKEQRRIEAERAEKFRIAEEQEGNALAREMMALGEPKAPKPKKAKKKKAKKKKGGKK